MVSFLNSWASGVVVAVIVGSIIEMILPESNNKKYVKTVIGIFILFTIISPVIVVFSGGIDLKTIIDYEAYDNEIPVASTNVISDNDVFNVYKEKISEEIKNTLVLNGYKVLDLSIKASSEEKNYGEILEIRVKVEESNTKIEKINIDISNSNPTEEISKTSVEEIKELLNSTYNVDKDNIIVN